MKPNNEDETGAHAAGEKGEKVRDAIGQALSTNKRDPKPNGSPAERAAQERLAEIERHVGELVKDPELEQEGAAREKQ